MKTCWFLAVDFDKSSRAEDARAYVETCTGLNVPAVLERSRSGNGGHVWIFFKSPVSADLARKLGTLLLTFTMNRRLENRAIGLEPEEPSLLNSLALAAVFRTHSKK